MSAKIYATQDVSTGLWYMVEDDNSDITIQSWFLYAGPFKTEAEALEAWEADGERDLSASSEDYQDWRA